MMRRHRIKALPVVDRYRHLVGIVAQADFLRHAGLDGPQGVSGLDSRLRRLIQATPGPHSEKPEVVGQIMTRQVRVISAERPVADLVPLFSGGGPHHIPVIGPGNKLHGMLTQADLVAALACPDSDARLRSKPQAATNASPKAEQQNPPQKRGWKRDGRRTRPDGGPDTDEHDELQQHVKPLTVSPHHG